MRVLVVNAGSSTLKVSLLDERDRTEAAFELAASDLEGLRSRLRDLPAPDAVGHRVVHGGPSHSAPAVITEEIGRELERLVELAPLHQPAALAAIDAVAELLPQVPAVACFDTAFHASLPEAARTYAIPLAWRELGIRRYGFHGLSHAYASRRVTELLGTGARLVICHLGAGASLCAVRDGRSVDTTMGFTPLEGLVMATRAGSIDPGIVLWLANRKGLSARTLEDQLTHEAGLLALAGRGDMREILAASDESARLALEVYVHRLRQGIGAMAATLDGLDALVFTGGVGEHQPRVRATAVKGLTHLGLALDPARNEAATTDCEIGAESARARCFVVTAREDLEIARGVRDALGRSGHAGP